VIALAPLVQDSLLTWADRAAPLEACGLLFGHVRGGAGHIAEASLCVNTAPEPDQFAIPAEDLLRHGRDPRWVGVWHSHPKGPARLSQRDRRAAQAWPRLLHVLVVPPQQVLVFASAAEGLAPLPHAAP